MIRVTWHWLSIGTRPTHPIFRWLLWTVRIPIGYFVTMSSWGDMIKDGLQDLQFVADHSWPEVWWHWSSPHESEKTTSCIPSHFDLHVVSGSPLPLPLQDFLPLWKDYSLELIWLSSLKLLSSCEAWLMSSCNKLKIYNVAIEGSSTVVNRTNDGSSNGKERWVRSVTVNEFDWVYPFRQIKQPLRTGTYQPQEAF